MYIDTTITINTDGSLATISGHIGSQLIGTRGLTDKEVKHLRRLSAEELEQFAKDVTVEINETMWNIQSQAEEKVFCERPDNRGEKPRGFLTYIG